MKMLFPKRNRYFMLLLNFAIIFAIWYHYYYQRITTPEYKNEEFVKHIKSFTYEPIGPVLWEEVQLNCGKFDKKNFWAIFKVSSVNRNGLGLHNIIYDGKYVGPEFLLNTPLDDAHQLQLGVISRHLAKKVMKLRENDLIFTSWNASLWNPIESNYFSFSKTYPKDLCLNFMSEVREPTQEEIERYKNLKGIVI